MLGQSGGRLLARDSCGQRTHVGRRPCNDHLPSDAHYGTRQFVRRLIKQLSEVVRLREQVREAQLAANRRDISRRLRSREGKTTRPAIYIEIRAKDASTRTTAAAMH